jgi:hypothetical protein
MMATHIANGAPSEFRRFWPVSRPNDVGDPSATNARAAAIVIVIRGFPACFRAPCVQPYAALSMSV